MASGLCAGQPPLVVATRAGLERSSWPLASSADLQVSTVDADLKVVRYQCSARKLAWAKSAVRRSTDRTSEPGPRTLYCGSRYILERSGVGFKDSCFATDRAERVLIVPPVRLTTLVKAAG